MRGGGGERGARKGKRGRENNCEHWPLLTRLPCLRNISGSQGRSHLISGVKTWRSVREDNITDTSSLEAPMPGLAEDILPKLALPGPCLLISCKF